MPLILIAVLGVFQILLFLVHMVLYRTIEAAFGWHGPWLVALFTLLSFSFVSASILAHSLKNTFVRWFYAVSAYWFGLVHFLFIGSVVFFFAENIFYRTNHYVSPALLGAISFAALFLVHLYGTLQSGRARITRVRITLPNLPEAWRGKKIVFLSDLHLGNIWRETFSAKLVDKIKSLAPEAVLIGGDVFDGVKCDPAVLLEPFKALQVPRGIFFASGNHEYIEDTANLLGAIRDVGIRILNNETVDVRGLQIAGVDYKATAHKENFEKVIGAMNIDRAKPSILIKHEPSNLMVAEGAGVSLQFSGHTHQGQLFPLSLITRRVYRGFDYGLKRLAGMSVYTSSGVGTWGPPVRLGTKSEIVLATLV